MSSKRKGSIGKHLPAWDEKAMEINRADVAELVDARDLKCLATLERSHLFWKTRSRFRHQPAGTKRDLENIFWGPLMALTVDRLLAAMRTARALHLHCRRIVLPEKHASFDARFVCPEELSPVFIAARIPASDGSGVPNSRRRNFKAAYFDSAYSKNFLRRSRTSSGLSC